jgi:hypothetical protein
VFKVGDRRATSDFYQKVLKMTPLRHEEFEEGCDAQCECNLVKELPPKKATITL